MSVEPKGYTNTHKGQITYKGQQANTTIGKGKPTTEEGGKSVKWLRGFDTGENVVRMRCTRRLANFRLGMTRAPEDMDTSGADCLNQIWPLELNLREKEVERVRHHVPTDQL